MATNSFIYNFNNQAEYIAYMMTVRTNRKKYENYIVNAIYSRVGDDNLIPVTQQYVKNRDSNLKGNHFLVDLYFPQLNYGIEVDESHHVNQTEEDKKRQKYIEQELGCKLERIKIYEIIQGNTVSLPYCEINKQINSIVKKIKNRIKKFSPLKWYSNDDRLEEVFKNKREFKVDDDVYYEGILQIYNELVKPNNRVNGFGRCTCYCNNRDYILWVPKENAKDFHNQLKSNGVIFEEVYKNGKQPIRTYDNKKRVTFLRSFDRFGKSCVRFVGVYTKIHQYSNSKGDIVVEYHRDSDSIKFVDLQ